MRSTTATLLFLSLTLACASPTVRLTANTKVSKSTKTSVLEEQLPAPWIEITASARAAHVPNGNELAVDVISPSGELLDGPAFVYWALDHPSARAGASVRELAGQLGGFKAWRGRIEGGQIRLKIDVGPGEHVLSLFVVQSRSETSLVTQIVQVDVGDPPPRRGRIAPETIAVFANAASQDSMDVAFEYLLRREIPPENLYVLEFNERNPRSDLVSADDFNALIQPAIDALPRHVNLVALAWTYPFRVIATDGSGNEMSITSAFMFGTAPRFFTNVTSGRCVALVELSRSRVYNSSERNYGLARLPRPTMMLAGRTTQDVFDLIDRGVASDGTHPPYRGYLVFANRSRSEPREDDMQATLARYEGQPGFDLEYFQIGNGAHPSGRRLMLYQTGDWEVEDVFENSFAPGAVADHLTSSGGVLSTPDAPGQQMNILTWLEAGASGSYGATREPCNFRQKFPKASVLIDHYTAGESLAEAYVKSVLFPQEGVFVGDPAACPYCPE